MAEILSPSNTENFRIYRHKKFNKPAPTGCQEAGGLGGGYSAPGSATQENRLQPSVSPGSLSITQQSRSIPQQSRSIPHQTCISPQQTRRGTSLKRSHTPSALLQAQLDQTQNVVVKLEGTKFKLSANEVSDLGATEVFNARGSRVVTPGEKVIDTSEKRPRVQGHDAKVFSPLVFGAIVVPRVPGHHMGPSANINLKQPALTVINQHAPEVSLVTRGPIVTANPATQTAIKHHTEYTTNTTIRPVAIKEEPLDDPYLLSYTTQIHPQHNNIPPPLEPIIPIQQKPHFSNQAVPLNLSAPKALRLQPLQTLPSEEYPLDLSTKNLKRKKVKKTDSTEHKKGQHIKIEELVPPQLLQTLNLRDLEALKKEDIKDLNSKIKDAKKDHLITETEEANIRTAHRRLKNRDYAKNSRKASEEEQQRMRDLLVKFQEGIDNYDSHNFRSNLQDEEIMENEILEELRTKLRISPFWDEQEAEWDSKNWYTLKCWKGGLSADQINLMRSTSSDLPIHFLEL